MRKTNLRLLSVLLGGICVFTTGCDMLGGGHQHNFNKKVIEEQYFCSEATCDNATQYYYSCECGAHGEKTFSEGAALFHDFSGEVETDAYLKNPANCQTGGEYFKSCVSCGKKSFQTFISETLGDHLYNQEIPEGAYLKTEATHNSLAVYYKSCVCGLAGEATFEFGETLREYTAEEKVPYTPTSLTVTLYDTATNTYGFTYNTQEEPLRPVIQVAKGTDFADYVEYPAHVEEASSYKKEGGGITYYIVKAEIALEASTTYTYRAYDKYVDIGTDVATLQTKDLSATKFTFSHLSDSQMSTSTGVNLGKVLSNVVQTSDLIVHTGDIVEWSKYESEWTDMLHSNFAYFSKIPVMAISGNHETTYQNGSKETYKHFNHNIPEQDVELGYYYSFTYGNAKFIMLNTNKLKGNALTSEQYDWLLNELENNTATWTIVAMHNPMYSVGTYGANPERNGIAMALRNQLEGIFAEYGVDIVLQGHDHMVSRTYPIDKDGMPTTETWQTVDGVQYSVNPNGVLYVMNGPSGTQNRSPYKVDEELYKYAQSSNACSWAEFAIDGNQMVVTGKYVSGDSVEQYYQWGIIKSA